MYKLNRHKFKVSKVFNDMTTVFFAFKALALTSLCSCLTPQSAKSAIEYDHNLNVEYRTSKKDIGCSVSIVF